MRWGRLFWFFAIGAVLNGLLELVIPGTEFMAARTIICCAAGAILGLFWPLGGDPVLKIVKT